MDRRKFMSAGAGLLAAAAAVGLPLRTEAGRRLYRGADLAFGATVTIQLLHDDESAARSAINDAFTQAHAIDRLLSLYREDSQVARLNRDGRIDRPDPHLLKVLREAQALSRLTQGAFDVTVQPLWHASAGTMDRSAAHALVGWRNLLVDEHEVLLRRPGMAITLNGIAQGYATDLALAAVRSHGIDDVLVDIGEFRGEGRPGGTRPWHVGIANPRAVGSILDTVRLEQRALATSGDYGTSFSNDFSRHHIVDPATGESPAEMASVTVAAPTAMLADGLSTALMVQGVNKGLDMVSGLPDVDALFVDKQGRRRWSAGFPFA